jgi:hypothetical protein
MNFNAKRCRKRPKQRLASEPGLRARAPELARHETDKIRRALNERLDISAICVKIAK